jgi:hypothetical protein
MILRIPMRPALFALATVIPMALHAARLIPADLTVGETLEVIGTLTLDEPAPAGGLEITLASDDPARILLSSKPDEAGKASIIVKIRAGLRGSPDYYIHGLRKTGTATYTASAPGFQSGAGKVELAPSGIIFARAGIGIPALETTSGAVNAAMGVYTALLDAGGHYVQVLPVAGGRSVKVEVASSDPAIARVGPPAVTIEGGSAMAPVEFHPVSAGETILRLSVPAGFTRPAEFASFTATVRVPGMAVTDGVAVGKNLQVPAHISLGEPAPSGSGEITLTSGDATKLLISASPTVKGSGTLKLVIPAGGLSATYYLQALHGEGTVTYSASAPGYRSREATLTLAPSGLVLGGPQGPPDEAELFREDIASGPHGFVTGAVAGPTIVSVYAVQLDPATHRGADITVQAIRAGWSLKAVLTNSNDKAGTLETTELVLAGGISTASTHFVPSAAGKTMISVATPPGLITAKNSTSLSVEVKE